MNNLGHLAVYTYLKSESQKDLFGIEIKYVSDIYVLTMSNLNPRYVKFQI